jgi:putative membrane protein
MYQMFTKVVLSALGVAAICAVLVRAQAATVSKRDADFLKMAAEADMTATHIGKVAEDRAVASGVKDLGRKLVQDHTSDYRQLTDLAAKISESVPKAIDKQDDREIANLNKRKGKMFDQHFLTQETVEHEKLIKAFKDEAEHGDNPDVKAYANKALPLMEGHLHEAQDLLKPKAHKA